MTDETLEKTVVIPEPCIDTAHNPHELIRIYADPISLGRALSSLQEAAALRHELEKMNKRLGHVIMITVIGTLFTAVLVSGLIFAAAG